MPTATCSIDGCDGKVLARGWCSTHYYRWSRHGDPRWARGPFDAVLAGRVDVGDCWVWLGAFKGNGYGNVGVGNTTTTAHRWVWENLVGPISPSMELDHLCKNRSCVNPDHLEEVTKQENKRRARKPTCKWGHILNDENLLALKSGARKCKTCHRERARRRRAETKEKEEA